MLKNRISIATSTVFIVCIGVLGVQLEASTGGQAMKQETGTATVQSTNGQIELTSAASGVSVSQLCGEIEEAGVFRIGDLITSVDGRRVVTPEHLLGYVRDNPDAAYFEISFTRNGRQNVKTVGAEFLNSFMTPQPPEPPPLTND